MAPEYALLAPDEGKGLLPWSWATERLANSRGHWLATTRPDGRPHVMIVWGIWIDDHYYFCTSPRSIKARNLAVNPNCVVCTERADEAVIVEGVAEAVTDPKWVSRFENAYREKYQEDVDTSKFPVYVVRPAVAFGFISTAEEWAGTATRWHLQR
jgi:nitroimidazol reductase NimA-like FMN-containing flavoprotein (pyridoxamine 5'-phosphate oxidase superfamily)